MTVKTRILACAAMAVWMGLASGPLAAQEAEAPRPPQLKWSFSGPFGKYDQAQLQRGFKIYREVCSNCHSVSLLSFRNLTDPTGPGFTPAQVDAIAADYKIKDGPNEKGRMFERPGRAADYFPPVFANEQIARATYNGALPPDFSVIAKARGYERGFPLFILDIFTQYQEQGVDYIAAVLKGYEDAPKDFQLPPGTLYNKYFPPHAINMPPPLSDGQVSYTDGSPQTVEQYSQDIAAFLMWVAEPHMVERKRIGFQVMVVLILFAGLLYFTKKKVWSAVEGHA